MLILLKSTLLINCLCVCLCATISLLVPPALSLLEEDKEMPRAGAVLIVLMRDTVFNCHYFQFYLDFDMLDKKCGLFLKSEVLDLYNFKRKNML